MLRVEGNVPANMAELFFESCMSWILHVSIPLLSRKMRVDDVDGTTLNKGHAIRVAQSSRQDFHCLVLHPKSEGLWVMGYGQMQKGYSHMLDHFSQLLRFPCLQSPDAGNRRQRK